MALSFRGSLVLVLSRLRTLRVSCMELWGRRVWEIRYGVILLYPLPCKVTSSSGCMKQLSQGSQGRGCRFSGWEAVSSGRQSMCEVRSPAGEAWRCLAVGWRGAGLSHAAALQLGAGEPSAEGSWEGRGCCIAGLRLEAVQMEMCLCQGGCDTEEQCPAHPLICLSLIHFFHVLFRSSVSFIPYAVICLVQLRR